MTTTPELESTVLGLVNEYLSRNQAARTFAKGLSEIGVGVFPVLDHITVRTLDIDRRAEEFLQLGYVYTETLNYDDWYAKVYRVEGYPALFIDQAYDDERGKTSIIPAWVEKFGDRTLHHIAILVHDIEQAMRESQKRGMVFAGQVIGEPGGDLRQIFTVPEKVNGQPFSVLELTERHNGYRGFSPPQANRLMQSTVQ
ncbi:MAG: VOC family protein [Nitrospira sp.]|nr:VOC family protein [Nitrospira sp.]